MPTAWRKAATRSAYFSVEYGPGGLLLSPVPGRSSARTAEVFGVGGKLERVAGVIRGQVGDQQEWLTLALDIVVDL